MPQPLFPGSINDAVRAFARVTAAPLLALAALLLSLGAQAADTMENAYWNMPKGVTDVSHDVFRLHMIAFWVCIAIGVVVFGVMFYSVFAHRRSKHPVPATFHHSTTVEIIWTIIPFVILIGLAIPAAGTLIKEYDTRNADMTIKVTGYQWKWQYEYVGEGVSFFSTLAADSNRARQLKSGIDPRTVPNYLHETDNHLVLPIGKKVRFLLTANDVIHGWWMPDLAIKKDAIPGYINEVWTNINEPGTYRGQCTVLCGRDHGFMPIVVEAKTQADYDTWLASKKAENPTVAGVPGGNVQGGPGTAVSPSVIDAPPIGKSPDTAANSAAIVDAAAKNPPAPATASVNATTDAPASAAAAATAPAPATEIASADTAKATPALQNPAAKPAAGKDDLIKSGEKVYTANCQVCHQANGAGLPPTFPALTGSKIATGPVDGHITQVLKGKNAMPPFATLSDDEIAAVVTYERNALGNHVGDMASAAQVAKLRGK